MLIRGERKIYGEHFMFIRCAVYKLQRQIIGLTGIFLLIIVFYGSDIKHTALLWLLSHFQ